MSCENIPSLLDLQNTKKHADDFGRLMGTGEGDSTNEVTGQVRPTYNKVMKSVGFKPGNGDFTTGFTVMPGERDIAWYDPVSLNWYSYLGVIPTSGYPVLPGTNPVGSSDWAPRTDESLRSELNRRNVNTVSDLSALTADDVGKRVQWSGYYSASDGGGNWGVVKSGAHIADGGSIFSISPTLYVEASLKGKRISVLKFGAHRDGVTDDVDAFQRCINYASQNKQGVYAPSGAYLFDRLTFIDPTGLYAQRGQNVFGMVFAKSDVTITGDKNGTVIKVANGQLTKTFNYVADVNSGTYQNHAMPGTKGFQIFVQHPSDPSVNNFNVEKLTIDMNGYNNKVFPLNAFGNQSQCMAMYIASGSGNGAYKVTFKNAPGSQVLAFWSGTSGTEISKCKFMDCGYLGGTNTNLDDHSTIFSLGTDVKICNNELTQSVQWVGKGGAPIEMHGTGLVKGNTVVKYLCMGVLAALVCDTDLVVSNNIGKSITALGYDVYNIDLYNLKLVIKDNIASITKVSLASTHPAYKYRSFIVTPFFNNSGNSDITLEGNIISVIGTDSFTDTEATYNSVINSKLIDVLKIRRNTFSGFRGPIINLKEQKATASILVEGNTFDSCGRKDNYVTDNSITNYDNNGNVSYGNTPFALQFKDNVFTSCVYSSYLSLTGIAAGVLLAPTTIQVDGDYHDRWVTTINTTVGGPDLPSNYVAYQWVFRYGVINGIDVTQADKVFPSAVANYTKAQSGNIEVNIASGAIPANFKKMAGVIDWNCYAEKFGTATPITAGVSPFGAKVGDRLNIINSTSGNGAGYYCTVAGSPGTWKAFGNIN